MIKNLNTKFLKPIRVKFLNGCDIPANFLDARKYANYGGVKRVIFLEFIGVCAYFFLYMKKYEIEKKALKTDCFQCKMK